MVYDIITVGSATVDIFLKSKSKDVEIERIHAHDDVCFPIGAKILVNELHIETGGGGANSAIAFSRLGFKTGFIGKIGEDTNSKTIETKLEKEKITFLGKRARGSTGCSIILSGLRGNRTILAFKGNNDKLKKSDVPKKPNTKWFYFGTMLNQSWKTQCQLAAYAKKKGIKIAFNPSLYLAEKGRRYLLPVLKACSVLILNKEEAQALVGKKGLKDLLKELQKDIPIVVITDGKKGAQAYNGIKTYKIFPRKIRVLESTGAGDSFATGFIAGLMMKKDIPTCLRYGAANAQSVLNHYGATNNLLKKTEIAKKAERIGRVEEC